MNYRLIAYSGIVTAILGALFGWAISYIGQPDLELQRYQSEFYQKLHRRYPLIGAGVGLAAGSFFAVVSQTDKQRDSNK
jgi:hypothetical protein